MYNVLHFNRENGFTLIEIIISLTILAIIVIAATSYYTNSIHFVHQSEIRSQALSIARIAIEQFKAEAAENWDGLDDVANNININNDIFSSLKKLTDYKIKISLADTGDDLKKVTVGISWDKDNKKIKLDSLIAER